MGRYLYNGVELPDINELWTDKETYPYAYITKLENGNRVFARFSSGALEVNASGIVYNFLTSGDNYSYEYVDGKWENGTIGYLNNKVVWSSTDVYYNASIEEVGGTLYLPATAPLPVSTAKIWKYNEIELPALPEWDMETYPYAVIVQNNSSGDYFLMADDETFAANADGDTTRPIPGVAYAIENGEWVSSVGRINCKAIWANHDILNSDGSVYLPASTPVPVVTNTLDPTALLMGWMVGKRVAGLRKTQTDVPVVPDEPDVPDTPDEPSGDPVAYLYNGVRLPDINEVWTDKETYPYALITVGYDSAHTADYYELFLSDQPVTARAYDTGDASYLNNSGATMNYLRFVLNGNAWAEHPTDYGSTLSNGKYKSGSGTFLYANYDVLKKADGTTYLAASEPVPVYE